MLVDSEVWSFKTCEQSLESDLTGHLHDVVYNWTQLPECFTIFFLFKNSLLKIMSRKIGIFILEKEVATRSDSWSIWRHCANFLLIPYFLQILTSPK